jgi:hypothetical protein
MLNARRPRLAGQEDRDAGQHQHDADHDERGSLPICF